MVVEDGTGYSPIVSLAITDLCGCHETRPERFVRALFVGVDTGLAAFLLAEACGVYDFTTCCGDGDGVGAGLGGS